MNAMGVPYLRSEQIKAGRDALVERMRKPSWIVRRETDEGLLSSLIRDRIGASARIMEIGSSNGRVLKSLQDRGFQNLIGVDIDDYLEFSELKPLLRTADLNHERFPADDGSIDALLALEIFEHLENPWHFARECARVLRPGGLLILSTPWGHTVWDKLRFLRRGSLINFHPANNHITFLTKDVFNKAFGRDFVIKQMIFDRGWIPFLRPRRWNRFLPAHPLWSLKVCYVMERKG